MYIHIDTVETGSPGLKYPAPEDSGLQERGETSFHGLKYPAPEDSGVYTYRYSGNRFTWFEVSGTGGFRSTDLEARGNRFTSNNPAPEDWKYVSSLFYL